MTSSPRTACAISPLALATAAETPLPSHALPPSRSSTASCTPVDAPDGTIAVTRAPATTSSSTVALPRESRTRRARTSVIALTRSPWHGRNTHPARRAEAPSNPCRHRWRAPRPPLPPPGADPPPPLPRAPNARPPPPNLELGIDLEPARDVDRREEDVTE